MSGQGVVSAGDSINRLLAQYQRVAQHHHAADAKAGTHRQKFQLASKLREAVERGVNPFRLAADAHADEALARTRAKQRRAKVRQARRQQQRTGGRAHADAGGSHDGSTTSAPASPPIARLHQTSPTVVAVPGTGAKGQRKLEGARSSTHSEAAKRAAAKTSLAFNTHQSRSAGNRSVPLAVQARHQELGLGERAASDSAAPASALQAASARNAQALQSRKREARRDRRVWVRPCTAGGVRQMVAGVGLPYRLRHVAREVSMAAGHADSATVYKWDRRRRRQVRASLQQGPPRPPTSVQARPVARSGVTRRARQRALVWETLQYSDRLSWGLVEPLLRERRRFLAPLDAQYAAAEPVGLTTARAFPLFGALVEVLDVALDAAPGSHPHAQPWIRQRLRRVGLVVGESAASLVVLLLPRPCETDHAACDAFIQGLPRGTDQTSAEQTPQGPSSFPFEVVTVGKLFPGGSGDLLDVARHVLATGQPREGVHRALLCVYLGEVHQTSSAASVLSCLLGRCF